MLNSHPCHNTSHPFFLLWGNWNEKHTTPRTRQELKEKGCLNTLECKIKQFSELSHYISLEFTGAYILMASNVWPT